MIKYPVRFDGQIGQLSAAQIVAETIARSGKPRKAIADEWGFHSVSYVDKMCEGERSISLQRALSLQEVTNSTLIAEWFAARSGGVFVADPLEAVGDSVRGCAPLDLAVSIKEFGELIAACARAMHNGELSPAEQSRIMRESDDVLKAIYTIRFKMRAT